MEENFYDWLKEILEKDNPEDRYRDVTELVRVIS